MNNHKLLIATLILSVLVIVVGILLFIKIQNANQSSSSIRPSSASSFPISNTTNSSDQTTSKPETISVALENGNTVMANDFIHNGVTKEDPQNTGNYYLAGSIGYCLSDGSCPSGATSTEYHIVYFSQDQSFIISLISEPIGQARIDAEEFLLKTLGLNQQQLCKLKYNVLTTSSVNSEYAGENLGFSFCPGAVALP